MPTSTPDAAAHITCGCAKSNPQYVKIGSYKIWDFLQLDLGLFTEKACALVSLDLVNLSCIASGIYNQCIGGPFAAASCIN